MEFLASDALRGRGSGTPDELVAATYVASQLGQYGIAPAGDDGTFLQRATTVRETLTAPPTLKFMTPGDGIPAQTILWTHGKEMLVQSLSATHFRGHLKRIDLGPEPALREAVGVRCQGQRLRSLHRSVSFAPTGLGSDVFLTHGLRSGLHSCAAARLILPPSLHFSRQPGFAPQEQPSQQSAGGQNRLTDGSVVLITGGTRERIHTTAIAALMGGALAVLVPASPDNLNEWDEKGRELPRLPAHLENESEPELGMSNNVFALGVDALADLRGIPDGTYMYLETKTGAAPQKASTWNAVGKLVGRDPVLGKSAILLSAHLDHLGVGEPVNGDKIYNGADDDASGTSAVLELARALGTGARPRRTLIFALFGSEEAGALGSKWFVEHPPAPLPDIAANLEFEMIGRPDPKYPGDTLWLTGWERSNLGPALVAHGAKLAADARPEEHFFMRSDNYVLARKGVVAQTISSYGLHADYHRPSDDLAHIDFRHLTAAIGSLIAPVEWLVNSGFRPAWKEGGKP